VLPWSQAVADSRAQTNRAELEITASEMLALPAPPGSQAVTAFLPFGGVQQLDFDPEAQLWLARLELPASASEGLYWIHLVATSPTGREQWLKIPYTLDRSAPALRVQLKNPRGLDVVYGGDDLRIAVQPVVDFLDLGGDVADSVDSAQLARAKSFVDLERVEARLGSTRLATRLSADTAGAGSWHGALELPLALNPGLYQLEVVATDGAGREHRVLRSLQVGNRAVPGLY
jgi:hypothetical protein